MIEGACLCGAVRFAIAAQARFAWAAYCHCSICRKQHGALFSTSIGVAAHAFSWRSGTENVVHFRVSDAFERPFCGRCGSKVPTASQVAGVLNVPVGLLSGDRAIRLRSHIFVGSKSPLATIEDSLPRHDAYPPGYALPEVRAPARELRDGTVLGSCLCNAVRFAVEGALERVVHCDCSRCRRSSGSAFKTLAPVARSRFAFTRSEARIERFTLPSEEPYDAVFCARCGSLLPAAREERKEVLIPVAAVDTAVALLPSRRLGDADEASWRQTGHV